jgi:phosphoglycerate dehydrogenase-like enzyme
MPRVTITTETLFHIPGPHLESLERAGFQVAYPAKHPILTEQEVIDVVGNSCATLAGSEPYTDKVLASLPRLRVISRNGVGYDRIDLAAATRCGVAVTITPDANYGSVAEHTLALLLAVSRAVVSQAIDVRQGQWRRKILVPLRGKALGIVGLGRIGRGVAERAAAFGMTILAYEKYPAKNLQRWPYVELVDLDILLARSDFVTLHVPLSSETRGLVNRDTLARMKRGSFVINTARGGLIVEDDLIAALESGQIAGAGLDVLAQEPPPTNHPLLAMPNVIVTPHTGGTDTRSVQDMSLAAAQNIIELLRGDWPEASIVNSEVREHWTK